MGVWETLTNAFPFATPDVREAIARERAENPNCPNAQFMEDKATDAAAALERGEKDRAFGIFSILFSHTAESNRLPPTKSGKK